MSNPRAKPKDDMRVPLLDESKVEGRGDSKRTSNDRATTGSVLIKIADSHKPKKVGMQQLQKTFSTKNRRKQIAEFIEKYKWYLGSGIAIVFAGGSLGLAWKFYYVPHMSDISDLRNQLALTNSNYNATGCPDGAYWYHPKVKAMCRYNEKDPKEVDNVYLIRSDYCGFGICESDFPQQLINELPALCIPIMHQFCNLLEDIDFATGEEFVYGLLFAGLPICVALLSVLGFYGLYNRYSRVTPDEVSEAQEVLVTHGLPAESAAVESLSKSLTKLEQAKEIFMGFTLAKLGRPGLTKEILQFANFLPSGDVIKKRNAACRALILKQMDDLPQAAEEQDENKSNESVGNHFLNLFKRINNDRAVSFVLKNGKTVTHERNNLHAESVAQRILGFAGLN